MNKINYILTTLLLGGAVVLNAQTPATVSDMQLADTLSVGYRINVSSQTSSYSVNGVNASAFEKSPHIEISKALYGKLAGLNVYQGAGSSADNVSSLSIHGHAPLVLIDGFPRDITDISSMEIESCYVLKDAAAAALYGMRGANGVILIQYRTEWRRSVRTLQYPGIGGFPYRYLPIRLSERRLVGRNVEQNRIYT